MGIFQNLFASFKRTSVIEDGVREVFSEPFKVVSNVKRKNICPEYTNRFAVCDYVIYDSTGYVRGVVLIFPHNGQRYLENKEFLNVCDKRNIKVVYFYSHMPNEKDYVVKRIRTLL